MNIMDCIGLNLENLEDVDESRNFILKYQDRALIITPIISNHKNFVEVIRGIKFKRIELHDQELDHWRVKSFDNLEFLSELQCDDIVYRGDSFQIVEFLAKHKPNLTNLTLGYEINDLTHLHLLKCLKKLVFIYRPNNVTFNQETLTCLFMELSLMPSLIDLEIIADMKFYPLGRSMAFPDTTKMWFQHIRRLKLTSPMSTLLGGLPDRILKFIPLIPNLESLSICLSSAQEETLYKVLEQCKSLTEVNIEYESSCSGEVLNAMKVMSPKYRHINIQCRSIGRLLGIVSEVPIAVIHNNAKLEYFNMKSDGFSDNIMNKTFEAYLAHKYLRHVYITNNEFNAHKFNVENDWRQAKIQNSIKAALTVICIKKFRNEYTPMFWLSMDTVKKIARYVVIKSGDPVLF